MEKVQCEKHGKKIMEHLQFFFLISKNYSKITIVHVKKNHIITMVYTKKHSIKKHSNSNK